MRSRSAPSTLVVRSGNEGCATPGWSPGTSSTTRRWRAGTARAISARPRASRCAPTATARPGPRGSELGVEAQHRVRGDRRPGQPARPGTRCTASPATCSWPTARRSRTTTARVARLQMVDSRSTCVITAQVATAADRLVVITPDAEGKGGSFDCYGQVHRDGARQPRCQLDRSNEHDSCAHLCQQTRAVLRCDPTMRCAPRGATMHDEFAGNPDSKTPNGYFEVRAGGRATSPALPRRATCSTARARAAATSRATGTPRATAASATATAAAPATGRHPDRTGNASSWSAASRAASRRVLLYPNKTDIDKYGPNDGWYCGKGVSANGCVGGDPDTMVHGPGRAAAQLDAAVRSHATPRPARTPRSTSSWPRT